MLCGWEDNRHHIGCASQIQWYTYLWVQFPMTTPTYDLQKYGTIISVLAVVGTVVDY